MHLLYTHCLNSVHQNLFPFSPYPLILIVAMAACPKSFPLRDEKFCSRGWSLAWQSGVSSVGEGGEMLACRDAGSTLGASFALKSCRIITTEVLKAWSEDQQEYYLEIC